MINCVEQNRKYQRQRAGGKEQGRENKLKKLDLSMLFAKLYSRPGTRNDRTVSYNKIFVQKGELQIRSKLQSKTEKVTS